MMSKARHTSVRRRSALAVAGLLAVPVWSNAQSDGTWAVDVGTAGGNWSDPANWVGGVVAGQGGTATFLELRFSTQPLLINQDLPTVELSGINFTGPFDYLLRSAPATTNSLTLTGSAVIHTALPFRGGFGHRIQLPILGSSGLTKTGPGLLRLEAANSFTGAVNILGGTLFAAQSPDAVFGDPGNQINLNDATLRIGDTWATSRTINLVGNGSIALTAISSASITLNGPITGAGGLNLLDSSAVHLTAHNTYGGPTSLLGSLVRLRGNGALGNTTSLLIRGSLWLENDVTNHTDRVNDSAAVTFQDGALYFFGNRDADSSEHLGPVTGARGMTTIRTEARITTSTLSMQSLSRENGAVVFFRGEKLGATPGNDVPNVTLQQPPPLVGGGGAPGSTNISIIPWAFGNSSLFQTDPHLPTSSLVTYGPTGVRPLNLNTEYASTIAAAGATDNVRLVSSEQLTTPATVNALVLVNSLKLEGPATLTISSGLLLSVGTATSGRDVRAPLNFGNAEAIILTPSQSSLSPPLTLSGPISGSGGLTKQGSGTAVFNAANTYTGTTRIGGGAAVFLSDVPASGPGPFGSDTSPIVFAGDARLLYAGAGTASFNRDLLVADPAEPNDPSDFPDLGTIGAANLVMNGNISLDSSLVIRAGSLSTVRLAGTISGDGMLSPFGISTGTIIITGDNTFTGSVRMGQAVWALGSDTALGTGIIPGGRIRAHGGPRIIANDLVGPGWSIHGDQPITFTGSMNLSGLGIHAIENSAVTTYAGTLHSGGLEKYGQGMLVLSGDNIYTGPTIVIEGVLRVAHSHALGTTGSPTTVAEGASLEITGGTQSNEPIIASGIGFLGQGAIRSISGHNSLGDLAVATGQTVVSVVEDSLTLGNVALAPAGDLRKSGPGRLAAQRYRGVAVQVFEGIAAVTPGRSEDKTSVLFLLNIASQAAQFDLGDNDLVVDHFSNSPLASVRSQISTAYADGAWTGAGITSSLADDVNFGLGYAESSQIFTTFPALFSGVLVDDTAVLVRFTRYGDANLDGIVSLSDFNRLAANFGASDAVWTQGDFNYDEMINLTDFNLLAGSFGLQAGPGGPTAEDWALLASAVPEPGAAAIAALCLPLLTRRSRARSVAAAGAG